MNIEPFIEDRLNKIRKEKGREPTDQEEGDAFVDSFMKVIELTFKK